MTPFVQRVLALIGIKLVALLCTVLIVLVAILVFSWVRGLVNRRRFARDLDGWIAELDKEHGEDTL